MWNIKKKIGLHQHIMLFNNAINTSVWYFCYFSYMLRAKLDWW